MPARCLLAACLLLALAAGARADEPDAARERVREVERHFQKLIVKAERSVVAIVASSNPRYPAAPGTEGGKAPGKLGGYPTASDGFGNRPGIGFDPRLDLSDAHNAADNYFGAGVVLDAAGLILTNAHLIDGARRVYVRASTGEGSYADVVASDPRSDLAVLRMQSPPDGLQAVTFATVRTADGPRGEKATVSRGMWLVALGHPTAAGLADGVPAASWGILSAVRRRTVAAARDESRQRPLHSYGTLLQTDARLTLGCSGAALLNYDGELVGLATPAAAVAGSDTAGGFALPMDANHRRIIDVLKSGREVEYGFLGVSIAPAGNQTRVANGLTVANAQPGTPAALAGLRPGDVIVAVDGNPVRDQDDLFLYIGAALAGNAVKLQVAKATGRAAEVEANLVKFKHDLPGLASVKPPSLDGLRVEYTSVAPVKAGEAGLPPGVLVRELEPGSAAEAKFKALGDAPISGWLITSVNGRTPTTPREFFTLAARETPARLRVADPGQPGRERELTLP